MAWYADLAMPLWKTCGKRSRSHNIRLMLREGRPHKQAVAIALDVERRAGCPVPGRDAGVSGATLILGVAVVVGALLLLRPLFKDAEENHRWAMEHDPVYRKSHQAMQIANAASSIRDVFTGRVGGRSSGQQKIMRKDALRILARHISTHPRYRRMSSGERQRLFLLASALMDKGASATDALAITHGLAHSPSLQRTRVDIGILEQGAPHIADSILKGRIRIEPVRLG